MIFQVALRLFSRTQILSKCTEFSKIYHGRPLSTQLTTHRQTPISPVPYMPFHPALKNLAQPLSQTIGDKIHPLTPTVPSITNNSFFQLEILDPLKPSLMIDPAVGSVVEKKAVRLIVIRRKKMKKHQLKKLRKRDKYKNEKTRRIREQRKENAFREELWAQMKEAEAFDAEKWVKNIIERSNYYAKKKEEEDFYNTDEGFRLKLKMKKALKFVKPANWVD